ncbi:hypothetical protein GCM10010156_68340 [Planobispora rosea]|uniref:Uncharacterized protein n=1 Tax=Planobispora rosea TaxID=35762 RepID=A0A8J3S7C5_PLARO|nr:hypothetical protein GCM10010156_68340 [Planobispora rosea]GIH88184.1 hypothetical protein Pro02_65920 [Planobispora rosea]
MAPRLAPTDLQTWKKGSGSTPKPFPTCIFLVEMRGFEPLTPSMRSHFAEVWSLVYVLTELRGRSLIVRDRPTPSVAVVTQLVTQLSADQFPLSAVKLSALRQDDDSLL